MTDERDHPALRQRVLRVDGARRARLTPVPGSDPEPDTLPSTTPDTVPLRPKQPKGPNDDQLLQDVPPHY